MLTTPLLESPFSEDRAKGMAIPNVSSTGDGLEVKYSGGEPRAAIIEQDEPSFGLGHASSQS